MQIYFKGKKPKLFDKDLIFGFWKEIPVIQRISLLFLVLLLIALPVGVLTILQPKTPTTTPASSPATPTITQPVTPPTTPNPTPTPIITYTYIKAILFNDANNNLVKEEGEEILEGIFATIAVCKLDEHRYACDQNYPIRFGYTNGVSTVYIWNVFAGYNDIWIWQLSSHNWYTPSSSPDRLINILEDQKNEKFIPLSRTPYQIYPTKEPPAVAGDVDGNACVDIRDFQILSNNFAAVYPQADFNNTGGYVDIGDYQILSKNFHSGVCQW